MKKIFLLLTVFLVLHACEKDDDNPSGDFKTEDLSMGQNSINDVYYNLATGDMFDAERVTWDIAFSTPLQSATILINEGAGVELYCVGDTNQWNVVNENSVAGLEPRYNDESDWNAGAFNVNAAGFPNYGWGTYHAGNPDHNVGGDSIYVIKLTNGAFKKFMVRVKLGSNSSNVFRWADLNGDNEIIAELSTSPYFEKKHFIHYSLVNKEPVEIEPDLTEWDLLFARYVIRIPAGPGVFMNYPVTGVLTNSGVSVSKVTGTDPENVTLADAGNFTDRTDAIGHDWKISDPVTHEISLADSTSYIIESAEGKKYLMYFTGYGGTAEGTIQFKLKTLE